jgi:hypothetical protein
MPCSAASSTILLFTSSLTSNVCTFQLISVIVIVTIGQGENDKVGKGEKVILITDTKCSENTVWCK